MHFEFQQLNADKWRRNGVAVEPGSAPYLLFLFHGWNKLWLFIFAVPMVAAIDESPFTVKLSDA